MAFAGFLIGKQPVFTKKDALLIKQCKENQYNF